MPTISITDRTKSIWRSRLGSAFRSGLACSIVGCITLFGPLTLQHQIGFPALSYVTVILIVSEATLGDALRGCWNAIYATLQGVLPAILSMWVIGPARFSICTIVTLVTLTTFVIVLPQSTHLIVKRIALAQIVILYSVTSVNGVHTGVVIHPVHVAVSTAVGAFAALLALLLPFPRLACYEVREKCKLFNENASERLNLYVKAFCAENNTSAQASITQAKSLVQTGSTLLQITKIKQESMQWERLQYRISQPNDMILTDRLQVLEIPLRGMEMALTSAPSFPIRFADQDFRNLLLGLKENIIVTLKKPKCSLYNDSSTVPEKKRTILDKSLQTIQSICPTQNDLPSFFFLFCIKLIHDEFLTDQPSRNAAKNDLAHNLEESGNSHKQGKCIPNMFLRISTERLVQALKCSLSLGLAVFFGMIFSKENGYWSGLTVAVGMAFGREATFKVANLKAQGTVLGCIFGVMSCFIFQRFLEIRFLSLLPWIIFTSFLRRSQMYGQAGAMSAVIGALIILGRKNYGPPSEFAIVRITEAFIGLTCSIVVELLLQPTRASSITKIRLSQSLGALHECIQSMALHTNYKNKQSMCLAEFKEKEKKLKIHVSALAKFIGEAEDEPNFWFLPFHSACYGKLLGSLSKILELLFFVTHAMGFLVQVSHRFPATWKELQESMDEDLDLFTNMVGSSIECLKEVTLIKSLVALEKEIKRNDITSDLELGKSPTANGFSPLTADENEMEKITSSFLQHSRDVIDKIEAFEVEEELKNQMILCLSALGFCMHGLMKETMELEKNIKDLIQWENPSSHVNLYEIHCKINALYK